jgi:hypothetical protein
MAPALPKTFKAAVFEGKNVPVAIKQLELKEPGPKQALVKVIACGVCHSDCIEQEGLLGDVYPRVPGTLPSRVAIGGWITKTPQDMSTSETWLQ